MGYLAKGDKMKAVLKVGAIVLLASSLLGQTAATAPGVAAAVAANQPATAANLAAVPADPAAASTGAAGRLGRPAESRIARVLLRSKRRGRQAELTICRRPDHAHQQRRLYSGRAEARLGPREHAWPLPLDR